MEQVGSAPLNQCLIITLCLILSEYWATFLNTTKPIHLVYTYKFKYFNGFLFVGRKEETRKNSPVTGDHR